MFGKLKRQLIQCRRYGVKSTNTLYVTTPIFYVNARPHLGHLYTMLLGDIRSRWENLKPEKDTYFLTGTDEHGLKVQNAAEASNMKPKEFTDMVSMNFKNLAEIMNIKYDRFIRTTDQDHVETVKQFWKLMEEQGYLYKGTHSGWYSISDETFYPESQIEEIEDKHTGKKKKISTETRNEVTFQQEENYFFKLSLFQDRLISYLEKNPSFIYPKSKFDVILKELKETDLDDLSVSRPSYRLSWGIDVPGDSEQKIYVWFDALLNYVTPCGLENVLSSSPAKADTTWPAIHVIGKDIARFHCIYWPIFLMAAGIELPERIIIHSHWLCDGFKMSKSLGNVVDPIATLKYYGQDSLRFFLAEHSNIDTDCNYSEEAFYLTRERLISKYANLVTRCAAKSFNIRESVQDYALSSFEDIDSIISAHAVNPNDASAIINIKNELLADLACTYDEMDSRMSSFDSMRAIKSWWVCVEKANQFFQLAQPWLYNKAIKLELLEEKRKVLETIRNYYIFILSETCRIASILILLVIPNLSSQILDRLAVAHDRRSFAFLPLGADTSYGEGSNESGYKLPIERVPKRSST